MSVVLAPDRGVTLIGGGDVAAADVDVARRRAPVVVAADGGADAARGLGIVPQAVVGDLDSLGADARAAIPADRLHRIAEQDSTDFDKCLRSLRAPFVIGVGFAGPRLDHTLAVMAALVRHDDYPVLLLAPSEVIFRAPPHLSVDLAAGTRVSLMPFGPVRGTSTGLRWPLDGIGLAPLGRIGTSNAATGPVEWRIDGPCLALLPKEELGAVLAGMGVA